MILDLPTLPKPLSPVEVFGREGPFEIEIGVGKGKFLRDYALANPDVSLLGLEKTMTYVKHSAVRLEKAGVSNVRLLAAYAEPFLSQYLLEASVDAYHVYFPDPWPKRKQQKRRLFRAWFLSEATRTLKPNGYLNLATDHEGYFRAILELAQEMGNDHLRLEILESSPAIPSNYHVKYAREGRALRFARFQRTKIPFGSGKGAPIPPARRGKSPEALNSL